PSLVYRNCMPSRCCDFVLECGQPGTCSALTVSTVTARVDVVISVFAGSSIPASNNPLARDSGRLRPDAEE
ncbi:MAG: hypothetical protein VX582_04670, partial [Actinomycetota bacterium]|nr:hypothetical protein [Actinomycetota bacterium]